MRVEERFHRRDYGHREASPLFRVSYPCLFGVLGSGTFAKKIAEQERSSPAASSGKDRAYKAGRLKVRGAGRESERFAVPVKARNTTRRREGTLL
jgi:hypothetical protein